MDYNDERWEEDEDDVTQKQKSDSAKPTRKKRWILVTIAVIVIIILLLLRSCGKGEGPNLPLFDLTPDQNVSDIDSERSQEEILDELNKKVAEGMINISMNLNPVFESGKEKGNLNIVNSDINRHPQVVEIYRDENEEMIYRSGLIPVGSQVKTAKLSSDLAAGTYKCTAYFNSIDEKTGTLLGKAGAQIYVEVRK